MRRVRLNRDVDGQRSTSALWFDSKQEIERSDSLEGATRVILRIGDDPVEDGRGFRTGCQWGVVL